MTRRLRHFIFMITIRRHPSPVSHSNQSLFGYSKLLMRSTCGLHITEFPFLADTLIFVQSSCGPALQAGNVKFVDLFQEPGGRSKGCAVVEYETPDEAHAAIRDLHDSELMGRMIFVREDREEVRLLVSCPSFLSIPIYRGAACTKVAPCLLTEVLFDATIQIHGKCASFLVSAVVNRDLRQVRAWARWGRGTLERRERRSSLETFRGKQDGKI